MKVGKRSFQVVFSQGAVDALALARAADPGKWTRQLLLRWDAEQSQFLEQVAKGCVEKAQSGEAHADIQCWVEGRFAHFQAEQGSEEKLQVLLAAQARDRIDRTIATIEKEVRALMGLDGDCSDFRLLADTLAPVIEALEASPPRSSPPVPPLIDLANALNMIRYTVGLVAPAIKTQAATARARAGKAPKVQSKNQVIEALATQFRKQNPEQSVRSMALKIGEKVKLKTNTVEKKLADMGF